MTYDEYAAIARSIVGKPYILGYEENDYTDLDPEALDCSEAVQYTYGRVGVTITDGAWLQYEATVPVDDLPVKIGDLVFLRNNPDRPNGIGHVAMLVSPDGTIVEAKGRNYGVVYSTLAAWKTKSTYAGRRRYAPFTAAMEGDDMIPNFPTVGYIGLHRLHKGDDYVLAVTPAQIANAAMADYKYDGCLDLAPGGTIPLHQYDNGAWHLYQDTHPGAPWVDKGLLVNVHPVGSGATIYRLHKSGGHLYSLSDSEGAPAWVFDGPTFGLGALEVAHVPATDPLIAAKAARYDGMAAIVNTPL